MINNSSRTRNELQSFVKKSQTGWGFGNNILYDMCKNYPKHDNEDVIVGKIWLIGRSYAAALERNRYGKKYKDFYHSVVAPKVLAKGKDLDQRIDYLNKLSLNSSSLICAIETHKFLQDVFRDISEMNKRSLASKYLHFHCPAMFFIFDSRANTRIQEEVKLDIKQAHSITATAKDYDKEYTYFCLRALELRDFAKQCTNVNFSPRRLDDFLLG